MANSRALRRWVRDGWRRAVFSAVALGVALAGAEVAARQVPLSALPISFPGSTNRPMVERTLMIPDPIRLWRMAEGTHNANGAVVRIDADGMRMPKEEGPAGAPLILTLGDSSIFSHAVSDGETLHDQLYQQLAAAGIPARVQCGATPGYSTVQTLLYLEEAGWKRSPDFIVIGNIWSDNTHDTFHDQALIERNQGIDSAMMRALSRSAFFRVSRLYLLHAMGRPTARQVVWPEGETFGVRRVPIEDYQANLVQMVEDARARGAGAMILALTNTELMRRGHDGRADWEIYFEVQRRVAEAYGIPRVEMTPIFRESGHTPQELFSDKMHPTALGHQLIAAEILKVLRDGGWPADRLTPRAPTPLEVPVDPSAGKRTPMTHSLQQSMLKQSQGDNAPPVHQDER